MEKKRKISIIGSTGSIGTQALEVIEKLQDKFEIIALAGGHNKELLEQQAEKFVEGAVQRDRTDSADIQHCDGHGENDAADHRCGNTEFPQHGHVFLDQIAQQQHQDGDGDRIINV